ncbi:uncharacterized protein F4822DRAFT_359659 [Hypoxylon trugodes]|uniref:uncharacterized protein n=1 Tax=Hypoxylon trugodes TaxID=326681 RepID=UPI002197FC9C|nr:uncharacterized protein F4822DRAFT_359659 [Hypoxylon trugodes]KAI1386000.1 hypothetical protein F4822DRAFT_359659 [Hypoxylon trugodes]
MKLVIGGSTGFVGEELILQAIQNPAFTSIIALSRRETPLPPGSTKVKSVVCDDFEDYSDNVNNELKDADACIWTIAITPSKSTTFPFEETSKISRDYATTAIRTISSLRSDQSRPFRFVYMSGHFVARSLDELAAPVRAHGLVDYTLMRGEAEVQILEFAENSGGAVQASVARPGMIDSPNRERREIPGVPHVELRDVAASLLAQVVDGFEKDTLVNDDLTRIGQKALAK